MNHLTRMRGVIIGFVLFALVNTAAALSLWIDFEVNIHYRGCWQCPGMRAGEPETCEHEVSDQVKMRLIWTTYAGGDIDPNDWYEEPFAQDFMYYAMIVVPWVDYEISRDNGQTWTRVWSYPSGKYLMAGQAIEFGLCENFHREDAARFWWWTQHDWLITRDGGTTWEIRAAEGIPR